MIIQGSNEPVIINLPETMTTADNIEVLIYNATGDIKRWSKKDIQVNDKQLICPLTEAETMKFPAGTAKIETKWQDASGNIKFSEIKFIHIEYRQDKKLMEE